MSEQEHNEYMKDVRWRTAGYSLFIFLGILLSGTGGVYSIKSDIKDLATQERDDKIATKHYIDSLHHDDFQEFKSIWAVINKKDSTVKNTIHYVYRYIPRNYSQGTLMHSLDKNGGVIPYRDHVVANQNK
ncbi:MAG: hypothetical protein P4L31_07510 [Candidatus Babeliales bacterium]|nr:hypothetical protein [Candidatus Babeliales bacterium]